MTGLRIGHGYDVHRLVKGRALVLGGVNIENDYGLLGHSDADVLVHAIMDSLLGALALGDIGKHFPDSDKEYLGISSIELLSRVRELIEAAGASVVNIDATIVIQRPKLSGFIPQMRENIAHALGVGVDRISVKATTEEGLGFTGTGEGAAAHSVALVELL